jgi:hypothetical protein
MKLLIKIAMILNILFFASLSIGYVEIELANSHVIYLFK